MGYILRLATMLVTLLVLAGCQSAGLCPYTAATARLPADDWQAAWEPVNASLKPFDGVIQEDDAQSIRLAMSAKHWGPGDWRINVDFDKSTLQIYLIDFSKHRSRQADEIMDIVEAALAARFHEPIKFQRDLPERHGCLFGP